MNAWLLFAAAVAIVVAVFAILACSAFVDPDAVKRDAEDEA